jgi:hypothetical protein
MTPRPRDLYRTIVTDDVVEARNVYVVGIDNTGTVGVSTKPITYLSDQRITATVTATLPANTDFVKVTNDGGTVRYRINDTATSTAGTPVATGTAHWIGPIANLTSIHIYISGGAAVLEYWDAS